LTLNSPASRAWAALFALLTGLVALPGAAQTVISPHDPTDRILLHHQKSVEWAREHRQGILPLEAVQALPRGFDSQLAPRLQGAALVVASKEGNILLTPAHLVEKSSGVFLLLPSGKRISVQGIFVHPDIPIARLVARDLPTDLGSLRVAGAEEAVEGRRALHLSGLHVPADPVLSRAHLIRRPLPPLERFWVSDVRHPDGHPLLTPEGDLLAIAFRSIGAASSEALTIGPALIREVLHDLAQPSPRGPEPSPR